MNRVDTLSPSLTHTHTHTHPTDSFPHTYSTHSFTHTLTCSVILRTEPSVRRAQKEVVYHYGRQRHLCSICCGISKPTDSLGQ
ncbi:hypothetical protein VUR80DRAFT_2848 [Thermomyces stellatus]